MSTSASQPSGSVLRNTDFRKLWAAQAISVYGTQVTVLAVPLVAALTLRVSPFEFALIGTLEFLPFVLKHLRRNWIRTTSTILAMAVCIFLFCTLRTFLKDRGYAAHGWKLSSQGSSPTSSCAWDRLPHEQ